MIHGTLMDKNGLRVWYLPFTNEILKANWLSNELTMSIKRNG